MNLKETIEAAQEAHARQSGITMATKEATDLIIQALEQIRVANLLAFETLEHKVKLLSSDVAALVKKANRKVGSDFHS